MAVTESLLKEYAGADALDLAAMVHKKEVSPAELVDAAATTIDRLNPELNAVVDGAFRAGALGARLVEGGFGGAAVALIRRAQAETTARLIAEEMVAAGYDAPSFSMI